MGVDNWIFIPDGTKQQGHTRSQAVLFRENSKFIVSLLDYRIYSFHIFSWTILLIIHGRDTFEFRNCPA